MLRIAAELSRWYRVWRRWTLSKRKLIVLLFFMMCLTLILLQGQCKGSTAGGQIKSWIDDHKAIVIGVCSAIGGLLLFAILSCLIGRCRRRRGAKRVPSPPMAPPGGWQGWNGNSRGPPMQQQGYYRQHPSQGWANGRGGSQGAWATPAVPPPAYPASGSSVRYA